MARGGCYASQWAIPSSGCTRRRWKERGGPGAGRAVPGRTHHLLQGRNRPGHRRRKASGRCCSTDRAGTAHAIFRGERHPEAGCDRRPWTGPPTAHHLRTSVSVAVEAEGILAGAVTSMRDEMFAATGRGAHGRSALKARITSLGGHRCTGFPYDVRGTPRARGPHRPLPALRASAAWGAPRSTCRTSPPAATTATSSSASSHGTWPPGRCWSRRRAG